MVVSMVEESKDFTDSAEPVSKSQRKRDAQEVRSLAARLIGLPAADLAAMPLDGGLRDEIERARAIRSHSARKRQLQFVAKMLRRESAEDIRAALDSLDESARQLNARQHRSEAWRDHLIEAGDQAIGELIELRRDADAQAIRQLLRNALREKERNKPPAAARSLFRLLRELDESAPLPPVPVR
jgi:ribosome-associated protein